MRPLKGPVIVAHEGARWCWDEWRHLTPAQRRLLEPPRPRTNKEAS
jgi:hypothetical protein